MKPKFEVTDKTSRGLAEAIVAFSVFRPGADEESENNLKTYRDILDSVQETLRQLQTMSANVKEVALELCMKALAKEMLFFSDHEQEPPAELADAYTVVALCIGFHETAKRESEMEV